MYKQQEVSTPHSYRTPLVPELKGQKCERTFATTHTTSPVAEGTDDIYIPVNEELNYNKNKF